MYLLATNFLGTQRVYRWYVYVGENGNEVLGVIAKINWERQVLQAGNNKENPKK